MNMLRGDLVFRLRDLSHEYNLDVGVVLSEFFNFEAQKQYKRAMIEGSNYYASPFSQEYSEHLFSVYERALKIKYGGVKE